MSWAKERLRSSLIHVAACADDTWALNPQDPFLLANQRTWSQYWRVSRALEYLPESTQETLAPETVTRPQRECKDEGSGSARGDESGEARGRQLSVRDVIPQSRLASYGNYYYDDRELLYKSDKCNVRCDCHSGPSAVSDLTECWMLPKVEYWFKRLTEEIPARRRDPLSAPADHLKLLHCPAASERYDPAESREQAEEDLAKRLRSVRYLWPSSSHSYHISPATSTSPLNSTTPNRSTSTSSVTPTRSPPFKIRVRRRTGRRAPRYAQTQAQTTFCPDSPKPLQCDPNTKIRFDSPPKRAEIRQKKQSTQTIEASQTHTNQRTAAAQSVTKQTQRGNSADSRSKNTTRPANNRGKTPARAKSNRAERSGRCHDKRFSEETTRPKRPKSAKNTARSLTAVKSAIGEERYKKRNSKREPTSVDNVKIIVATTEKVEDTCQPSNLIDSSGGENTVSTVTETKQELTPELQLKVNEHDSTQAIHEQAIAIQKRLYSTVLSTVPPVIITPVACKIQGLVKLTSKLAFTAITRKVAPVDTKFEELEREALEQYKASDESIDSKFQALEKQAMDQYSGSGTSNSNTSCSSGQSGHCKNVHCSRCKCKAIQCGGEQSVQCDIGHSTTEQRKCAEQSSSRQCIEESSKIQCTEQCGSSYPTEQVKDSSDQKNPCNTSNNKSPRAPSAENAQKPQKLTDLTRASTSSTVDLKNVHVPLRGDKKESRQDKNCRLKSQKTASDTDEPGRLKPMPRWTLYVMPSKLLGRKSSSDEEDGGRKEEGAGRDANVSAHGAGDHDTAKHQVPDFLHSPI